VERPDALKFGTRGAHPGDGVWVSRRSSRKRSLGLAALIPPGESARPSECSNHAFVQSTVDAEVERAQVHATTGSNMKGPSTPSSIAAIARRLTIGGKRMRKRPEKTKNGQNYGDPFDEYQFPSITLSSTLDEKCSDSEPLLRGKHACNLTE